MVMRNRHEGGTPQWWDDLPPRVRSRFSHPPTADEADAQPDRAAPPQPARTRHTPSRGDLLIDLTRFAMFLFLAAIVILLYLLVALSYVNG